MKSAILFSITDIERETGISRDTLRIWERRYGFPAPLRNQRSERMYTAPQLGRLRLLKQLLDRGLRPGKLVKLDDRELRQLTIQSVDTATDPADVVELLTLLTQGPRHELRYRLNMLLEKLGLRSFLTDVVAPLNHAVGEAWFNGKIGIFDEHYYSEQVRRLLTVALDSLPSGADKLRVLLTTLPGEPHSIGLLMVACMLSLEGAQVLLAGVQTPLDEIVRGAVDSGCCIVGISCSAHMGSRTIASQLVKLRKMLPSRITVWAGGNGVRSMTFLQGNIRLFTDLNQIPGAIQALHTPEPAVS
jgi:DNA-binding transcriptional MerR regulator/methylmalonyl-CoA mutase cobalamin-binding subunit